MLDEVEVFLDRLLADLQKLNGDFRALEVALRERKSETIEAFFAPSQELIAQLDEEIEASETRWRDLDAALDELQIVIEQTRVDLLRWITLLTILLTAVLAWLAISQYLAVRYAWNAYHRPSSPRIAAAADAPPLRAANAEIKDEAQ